MNKIIKLNSKQGAFDTTSKKLCDFTIPRDEVYNMKNSFINVRLSVNTVDPQPGAAADKSGGEGVYMFDLGLHDDTLNNSVNLVPNVALVKNCFLSSQTSGKIDDIRRVDCLKTIQYTYEKDLNEKLDESYYSLRGSEQFGEIRNSPFVRREKEGSDLSESVSHDVKIRLSELFDICNEEAVDCRRLGDLETHLEMRFDKLRPLQSLKSDDDAWDFEKENQPGGATHKLKDMENHTYQTPAGGTGNPDEVQSLTTSLVYSVKNWKQESPFWVGQKVAINGRNNAAAFTEQQRIITQIDFSTTTGQITLTFDSKVQDLANTEILDQISVVGVDATASVSIETMELVLEVVSNPQNVPSSYVYYSYDTEEDNLNNSLSVKKNYMIDANCMNCYVGFGDGSISTLNTGSLIDYRITQNNEDLYDREVVFLSPLHYENISRTYMNNGRQLKCLLEQLYEADEPENVNLATTTECIMFTTLERDDNLNSVLGLEINTKTAGVNQIRIFQEKKKQV